MKRIVFLIVSVCLFSGSVKAQDDPLFTQYLINPQSINPAYAGSHNMVQATLLTRLQWLGAAQDFGAPNTNLLSVSMPIASQNLAFGINVLRDNLGFNTTTELDAISSYRIYMGKNKLSFGVTAGFVNRSIDFSKVNIFDTGDSAFFAQQTGFKPTFGFGAYYITPDKYIGFSVPRLRDASVATTDGEAFKRQAYLTAGMLLNHRRLTFLRFRPSFLLKYVENGQLTLDLSGSVIINDMIFTGLSVRNYNSVNLFAQLQISRAFRAGYSLDLATNDIFENSYGTHEISLLIGLPLLHNHRLQTVYF
ncbi:MAG: type IX secretion system membrane protein PorP/SprF [Cyclobacteriaceae bacterium]